MTEQERVLMGGGDMGARMRSLDWSHTPLGPVEGWPPALRTSVSVVLGAPHALCLFWGPEFVALYNDGYRRLLGAPSPAAPGVRARSAFAEDWPRLGPLLDGVMRTQTAASLETPAFTRSFTPVRDEHAHAVGVLCFASELPAAREEHTRPHPEVEAAHLRLANLVQNAPAFVCTLRGPEHVFELVNPRYQQLVGPGRRFLGLPVREATPEAVAQGLIGLLDTVYRTGEPFAGRDFHVLVDRHGTGQLEDLFVTFVYQPRRDARGQVEGIDVFGFEVTEQVLAQQRAESLVLLLRESQERQRRVVEASGAGLWELDGATGRMTSDARMVELMGLPPGTSFDWKTGLAQVHPAERELLALALTRTLDGANEGRFFMVFRTGGRDEVPERWVEGRAQRLLSADGQRITLAGALLDITERKLVELLRARQARNLAVSARVGVALSRSTTVRELLQACVETLLLHLRAALVRIWLYEPARNVLELAASDGLSTLLDDAQARVPVGQGRIGLVARERRPHLSNTLQEEAQEDELEWLRRERLVGFAGYPLRVGDTLVGVVALFSYHALPSDTLDVFAQVATSIALGVQRLRAGDAPRGGGLRFEPRPADMHGLTRAVVEELEVLWPSRQMELRHEGEGHGTWDPDWLGQAVRQLVTQALQSSPEHGFVRVATRAEGDEVTLSISHAGEPLLGDTLAIIIARSIVGAHGGSVSARSTPETGTTFTLRLPRSRP